MNRILFIGDIHFRHVNPRMRIDSYFDEVYDLVLQSLDIAEEEECDTVVVLGDLFDHYEPSAKVRNSVIDLFSNNPRTSEPWKFKLHCVLGNHDLKYHNVEMVDQTAIGTLLRTDSFLTMESIDGLIYCGHYHRNIEFDDISHRPEPIYALHAYILPERLANLNPETYACINTFKVHENCQLVITGHYHDGYGAVRRDDGVIFCNPGALSRSMASKANIERDIYVILASVEDGEVSIRRRILDYTPSGKIFNFDKIASVKEKSQEKQELATKLTHLREEYRDIALEEPREVFQRFASDIGMSKKATRKVLELLQNVIAERST